MVFVELMPFVHFREEHWTDEGFGALQRFLLVTPTAGDVIRGTHGLRKLRWTARGRIVGGFVNRQSCPTTISPAVPDRSRIGELQ